MKLQQIETESEAPQTFTITENEDGSISFELADGTPVTLRELKTKDTLALEQFAISNPTMGNGAATLKLASLMCTQWGDKPGIGYEELIEIPFKEFKPNLARLGKALEYFRLEDLLDG